MLNSAGPPGSQRAGLNLQQSTLLLAQAEAWRKSRDYGKAVQCYQQSIAAYPANPAAYHAFMQMLLELSDYENAGKVFNAIPAPLYEKSASLRNLHALLLIAQGQYGQAAELLGGLKGQPGIDEPRRCFNLAACFSHQEQLEAALGLYEQAHRAGLRTALLYKNWAGVAQRMGDTATAERLYREGMKGFPGNSELEYEYAHFLLKSGQFARGFPLYARRWKSALTAEKPLQLPIPKWDGKSAIRSLLLIGEQGVGDQIVYASLLPSLRERVPHVTLAMDARLQPLIERTWPGFGHVSGELDQQWLRDQFDAYLYAADAGALVPEASAWAVGYLKPDAARAAALRQKYQALFPGKKLIGISWRSRRADVGARKTVELLDWRPLLEQEQCRFVCLQYDDASADIAAVREQLGIDIYKDPDIDSFNDLDGVVAQMHALDLVISTSSTTAHLAAATDAPTWVVLPKWSGLFWYWGCREAQAAWYPRARLFRAQTPGVWAPVMASVKQALEEVIEND